MLPVPEEVTVIVPVAVVVTFLAAPIRNTLGVPTGLGEALAVAFPLGEGEPCALPPAAPQATPSSTSASSAVHLLTTQLDVQVRSSSLPMQVT